MDINITDLYVAGLILSGSINTIISVIIGYWIARNAQDKPFRSPNNPITRGSEYYADIEGKDPYDKAMEDPG